MITEDYCDFEIAKLLKEKGFDSECDYLYVNGNIVRAQGCKCNWNKGETIFTDYKNECSAPTLQMAMKWLREVHGLHISLEPYYDYDSMHVVFLAFVQNVADVHEFMDGRKNIASYPNVEKSYELAIKYCLENLI